MKKIQAKKGNGGYAIGKIIVFSEFKLPKRKEIQDIPAEKNRFRQGLSDASNSFRSNIDSVRASNDEQAAGILEAQLLMLEDEQFEQEILDLIEQNTCAEFAVYSAAEKIAEELQKSDSEYLRERSSDILNVAKKLIGILSGISGDFDITEDAIVFAGDISPEEIIRLDKSHIKGIATVKGSSVSHTAILAGTYGIPYVFGIADSSSVTQEMNAVIDGEEGILILEPDEEIVNEYKNKINEAERFSKKTSGSLPVKLYANIAGPADLEMVIKNGAEGIGLFRTEFLFMKRKELPSEEEQFEIYKHVAEAMDGKEVIIRTMDIGTDKKTECLKLPDEENPALGKRAIRICLEDTALFRTQLRALLRAACFGNIKIMYPMIASEWEIDAINEQLMIAENELRKANAGYRIPDCGIMVETPAAAVTSDILAKKVKFFSIGTNDLTQYTLAADRVADGMEKYFDSCHEAVFRLIKLTVDNAHKYGVTVGICGEMGGNPEAIPRLLESGVDELSMSPGKIPKARQTVFEYIK